MWRFLCTDMVDFCRPGNIYVLCSLQYGDSILHEACSGGHTELATIILSSGMPVDVRNDVSWYTVYM